MKGSPWKSIATSAALRLPFFLLAGGMLVLYLRFPYGSLDSDVTTFGIMGNDILRYGYFPTLTIGQDYLFSLTPYVYALFRIISCDAFSHTVALTLAGSFLSLFGLWLVYESLLSTQAQTRKPLVLPAVLFCLLVAASPQYVFDLSRNSGIEVSLFVLGVIVYSASRADSALDGKRNAHLGTWLFLGMASTFALCSRPQIFAYGLIAMLLLLIKQHKCGGSRSLAKLLAILALGACAGYFPMILHNGFRANTWPFTHRLVTTLGSWSEDKEDIANLFHRILPGMFSISQDHPVYSVLILGCIACALLLFCVHAFRRRKNTPKILDVTWVAASILIILIMVFTPILSQFTESRRYCLHGLLAVAWCFSRFCVAEGKKALLAVSLAALTAATSISIWRFGIATQKQNDELVRLARDEFIPELEKIDAVILTDYWDAYLLAFLAEDRARIEAYPWELVRTYGAYSEAAMRKRTVWLIRSGYGHDTFRWFTEELSEEAVKNIKETPLTHPLLGREAALFEFSDPAVAVDLMKKHHPKYFSTRYPP